MYQMLLITLGGAAGTLARYLTGLALLRLSLRTAFPLGTLAVNSVGCLLMGLLQGLFLSRVPLREEYRFAILIGVLGGYTTFSSFAWDTLVLFSKGQYARGAAYFLANNAIGLAAVVAGYRLMSRQS